MGNRLKMKINEIITEGKTSEMDQDHDAAHQGMIYKARDVGGYDRTYHMNRMMMAMAIADGKSTNAVDSPADTWFEKYNTIHPYTKEEDNKVKAALKTIPSDVKIASTDNKSHEPKEIQTSSPVATIKKNKYGV